MVRFAIFAKAPRAGSVKTRLIPALGPEGAASLYRRLAVAQIERTVRAAPGGVDLWCAPDADDEFFARCAEEFGVDLYVQPDADLGTRMHTAAVDTLRRADAAVVIGTDCPGLTVDYLAHAASQLEAKQHDVVIGPCEDGGYALIGMRAAQPGLFSDIAWSTPEVAATTLRRLRALGLRWQELPLLWDVDDAVDLPRLARWESARGK